VTPSRRGSRRAEAFELLTARRRRTRRRARVHRRKRLGIVVGIFAVAVGIALATVGFGGAVAYQQGCSLSSLREIAIGENTFIYAADGSLLGVIPAEKNRQPVNYSQIDPWLPLATVAIEDKRFYSHGGVDPEGMARALWADVRAGKAVQGGSTITQQLVRNLYNGSVSNEKTVQRKLKEACLAIKLSHKWSKKRILTAYMNQVYYGSQAYGVEAASETFFSKHAHDLTLSQAALLAGLPQAPSDYDPFRNPDGALRRRNEVLRAMLLTNVITPARYYAAVGDADLQLKPGRLYKDIRQPYFFSYVHDELAKAYGEARVRSGGLRVYTTIDPRLQRAARKAIRETLYYSSDPAAAVVAINPANGAIRAMEAVYPGRAQNQYNLIAQAHRQAGSTFKTFVLATAVEQGMSPSSTTYLSAPFHYQPDPYTTAWDVQTYDHSYLGGISVEQATLRSDNTVYARLTLDVGPENVGKMAYKLGVRTPLTVDGGYVPSMGLGAIAVTPLDMASAYSTIAAGGVYSKPMAIRRVVLPNGKVDQEAGWGRAARKRVISDGVAYEVTRILEENVVGGTGVGARLSDRVAAGKTGTTDNHADAWFCGFTPQLEATVWVGYPRAEIPMTSVHGIAVAGGTFPATICHQFMAAALWKSPALDFPQPKRYPTFVSWHGQWAYAGGGYDSSSSSSGYTAPATSATTTSGGKATPRTTPHTAPATTVAPPPPPPPVTTAPVPTEPPPATTEPPPPPPGNP
jgi:penicillin-binding protein 1A